MPQATSRLPYRMGFEVMVVDDGWQAVEQSQAASLEFDLARLDFDDTHWDETETRMQIREIRPDAKVMLTSGHDKEIAN
ncbi:MAG: hypothetical protein VXZ82_07520 [Planctomycetota bacterium]|nr:hypothetical protein [Planctomycetota bacterium]